MPKRILLSIILAGVLVAVVLTSIAPMFSHSTDVTIGLCVGVLFHWLDEAFGATLDWLGRRPAPHWLARVARRIN